MPEDLLTPSLSIKYCTITVAAMSIPAKTNAAPVNLKPSASKPPASGASIVRHNGKAVLNNVELKNGDRIQIGKGTYIFVPLCGENFQWED